MTAAVTYRLGMGEADVARAAAAYDPSRRALIGPPLLLAERGGALVGFLATTPSDEAVIAGPFWLHGGRGNRIGVELLRRYDALLADWGIRSYLFSIEPQNAAFIAAVERVGLRPYAVEPTGERWYVKRLPGRREREERACARD